MPKTLLPLLLSVATVGVLLTLLAGTTQHGGASRSLDIRGADKNASPTFEDELQVYCAASNRAVLQQILDNYRAETGRVIVVQYGASQALLSQIELSGRGDLFLPADDSYLDLAESNNLITKRIDIATMNIGAVTRRGTNLAIQTLDDLMDPSVRLVQATPDATAVGRVTKRALQESGNWEPFASATVAFRGTVTEVANDVLVGAADVGIVYDGMLHTYDDLQFIPLPELQSAESRVAIGVLAASRHPTATLHLARYITAKEHGLKAYAQHGFQVDSVETWPDEP